MREKLVSSLIGAFDHKGLKVVEEGGTLKTNEVRYEFIGEDVIQLNYRDCPHTKILESVEGFKLIVPDIDLQCDYGVKDDDHCLWIKF